jgi:hypothetical protein
MLKLPPRLKRKRSEDVSRVCPAHRAWVRRHQCSIPRCQRLPIECAHVRTGSDGGTALKPADCWLISLCRYHHAEQHRVGEASFAARYGLDLIELAREFASRSPHAVKIRQHSNP